MRAVTVLASSVCLLAALVAHGQSTWDKGYNISGRPAVQVSVDVASVAVRSCGDCRTVHIHVDGHDNDLSRWHVTEMHGGNVVHFDLKRRDSENFFMGWHGRAPEVVVDVPTESDVELRSGNGAVQLTGVHGSVDAKTGNGALQADDVKGALRITSGNGSITVHGAEGTVSTVSGNGAISLAGRLSQIEVRSGNGSINVVLEPGTALNSGSRVTTGHGSISMRVPRELKAEVDLSTGNGPLHCDLPLMSQASSDRHIHGSANGGGASLTLHSGAGGVTLSSR
jgi:hypothetical protein